MEEIVIKDELNTKDQCHTCLSTGRKLKPIGEYFEMFKKIVSNYPFDQYFYRRDLRNRDNVFEVHVCWECESVLKKAFNFQKKAQKANELLQSGQNILQGPFSNLTTVLLNETHRNIIYINELNINMDKKHDTEPEISDHDNFDDNLNNKIQMNTVKTEKKLVCAKKIKKTNKWALERARLNKKPKFKIVENYSCYKKAFISVDELPSLILRDKRLNSKYRCVNCLEGFKKESLLLKHEMDCKQNSYSYICDICKQRFLDKRHLSAHIQKHYDKYSCVLCAYVCFKMKDMKIHTQKNHKRVFECIKCGLKFGRRREFFRHYKQWHEKFICDICGVSFKMRYSIEDHIRKQHTPLECKLCNKRFARYGGLWIHNKTMHSTKSVGAYCVECDKTYADIYRYKSHLNNSARHRVHKEKKKYPCPNCDKVFTKNIYMKNHNDLVHLKNYKNRCEECDKNYLRQADLMKHRRRVHEGILPPKNKICYVCGRGFTTRKILTNHLRTHTGCRPYSCACGARFAQRTARDTHARAATHSHCKADTVIS